MKSPENTKKQYPMMRLKLLVFVLLLSPVLFAQTDSTSYFLQKGLDEKQKGRRMESLRNFERAAKYESNNKVVLSELASGYMDLRKYYQAKETYKKLVDLGETSVSNYNQLLQLCFNLKSYDEALTYASNLKKVDPSEKVSFYFGKINYDRENYGEALKYLNEDSKYGWIYELGLICYAQNDNKNALKYIQEAGDKGYPKDNGYIQNLGIAYIDAGNFDNGITILTDLIKKRPSDLNLLDMVAEAYYDKTKYDGAMNYWDTILGYDKTNASALYMIGMCYQKKGDKAKGTQLCDKAIEMDPSLAVYKQKKQMPGL